MTQAAFFDLDNTIIVGTTSLYLYIKFLVERGEVSRWQLVKGLWYTLLHRIDLVDVEKMLDKFTLPYKGRSDEELRTMLDGWFDSHVLPLVAKEAQKTILRHKEQGHKTVLLSTSTQYVCNPIREKLGIDYSLNSQVEVIDGTLTGLLKKPICFAAGKVLYANEFAKSHNIDLKKSYFYTDSITDLPMLTAVGFPQVVNPDPLLRREAAKRGWQIQEWKL